MENHPRASLPQSASLPLWPSLKRVLRYTRLYGGKRTWAKIQGRRHLMRRFETLPARTATRTRGKHVGIIGCGSFAYSTIAHYLAKQGRVLRGVADSNIHRAASLAERYGADYYTSDSRELLDDPGIDLVYVASINSTHAPLAVAALNANKHVHLEKPHILSLRELDELCQAMSASAGRLAVGFNRPVSPWGRRILDLVHGEAGPTTISWSITGHAVPQDHWIANPGEGGRIFGNLCHWLDFTFRMVPGRRLPISVSAVGATTPSEGVALTLGFGDGSVAALTLSTTHEPLDGVRERLTAQRGGVTVHLENFQSLTVEGPDHSARFTRRRRHLGHGERVERSYRMSRAGGGSLADPVEYVYRVGRLMLAAEAALKSGRGAVVEAVE